MKDDAARTAEEWPPQVTAEIRRPLLEDVNTRPEETPLPRTLAQAAAESRARRRVLALLLLFAILVALQSLVLVRLPDLGNLIVYEDPKKEVLISP